MAKRPKLPDSIYHSKKEVLKVDIDLNRPAQMQHVPFVETMEKAEKPPKAFSLATEIIKELEGAGFTLNAFGSTTCYNRVTSKPNLAADRLMLAVGFTSEILKRCGDNINVLAYSFAVATQLRNGLMEKNKMKITLRFENEPDISFVDIARALPYGSGANCYFVPDCGVVFHEEYGAWFNWSFVLVFETVEFLPA